MFTPPRLLVPALGLFFALGSLMAGAVEASPDSTAPASSVPGTAPTEDAFPVEIEHKFGTTVIEERPERVVTIGYNDHDFVLAFGVEPVAARWWYGAEDDVTQTWTGDYLTEGEPEVLLMPELNVEAIAVLEPDLIIGIYSDIDENSYEHLSEIAPTVAQSGAYVDYGMPWQEVTRSVGAALGQPERAEQMVTDLEGRFADARQAHPEWEGQSVVVAAYGDGTEIGFFASQDPRSRFFTELGFTVDAEFDEVAGDMFYGTISPERIELLDQDVIVWDQISFTEGGRATLEADPLVASLDAMEDGRAIVLEGDVETAFGWSTVLSIPFALDAIVPLLETALPAG